MMGWLIALLAGTITGILSAFGIGGGSLLLIYLTSFAAIDQHQAQGINLLYFLPARRRRPASPPQAWSSGQKGDPPRDFSGLGRPPDWLPGFPAVWTQGCCENSLASFFCMLACGNSFTRTRTSLKKMTPNGESRGDFRSPRLSLPIICISAAMTSIYSCGKTSVSANCCSWILFFRMRSTLISMAMI